MAKINMDSIIAKAQKCMGTSQKRTEVSQYIDKIVLGSITFNTGTGTSAHTPEEAADKFISVLCNEIRSHAGGDFENGDLGMTAIDALTELNYTAPRKVGENQYIIEVYFSEDLSRPSLMPQKYDGIPNIAALLNNGYSAGHIVKGMWHGEEQISLDTRSGTQFIDQAIRDFMGNYASEYGVIGIEPDPIYK